MWSCVKSAANNSFVPLKTNYQEMAEVQKYAGTVRKQMQEGLTDTEEMRAIKEIRQKYKACYTAVSYTHLDVYKRQLPESVQDSKVIIST